ncbi:MAG TPA: Gfo/Idh/MocA family oxidoreductase [Gemmataceae bacterium]|nr:Gfo/Idh/MocA family oxidoreductase [Gemmataceae bacterium]
MSTSTSRRKFLKQGALAGTGFWVAGGLTAAQNKPAQPGERVNVAVIGSGGRGGDDLNSVNGTGQANIVALCDVDEQQAGAAFKKFPKAGRYQDFRVMLEKQKDIDAVIVATPDHVHAVACVTAMRLGKHVYCEKPLCHSVYECRVVKEVAQRYKVATQMGNQGTAGNGLRTGVEIVQSGAIGDVREVHIWTNRPIWPQNMNRPKNTTAVPKTLNWDLWLGPAPFRPFNGEPQGGMGNRGPYLPFNWRGWWDFGTGALGDMACHTMNLPFMALRLGYPTSVTAELDTPLHAESGPMGCRVTYEFPVRGKLPAVTLKWYERSYPPDKLLQGQMRGQSGSLMIGSRGTLFSRDDYGQNNTLLPVADFKSFKNPAPTLPRVGGNHHREWIDAIRGGRPAMSNFVDYAALLAEVVVLGNVAIRCGGKRVVWDAEKMRAVDLPQADRFIRREYRKGWNAYL